MSTAIKKEQQLQHERMVLASIAGSRNMRLIVLLVLVIKLT